MLTIRDSYGNYSSFSLSTSKGKNKISKLIDRVFKEIKDRHDEKGLATLHNDKNELVIDLSTEQVCIKSGHEINRIQSHYGNEKDLFITLKRYGITELMNKLIVVKALSQTPLDYDRLAQLVGLKEFPQERMHEIFKFIGQYEKCMAYLLALSCNPDLATAYAKETSEPEWESFVVRKTGWEKEYASSNQKEYGSFMYLISNKTASQIKEGKTSYKALIENIVISRKSIGYFFKANTYYFIGELRPAGYLTRLNGIYHPLSVKMKDLLMRVIETSQEVPYIIYDEEPEYFKFVAELEGEKIELSHLAFDDEVMVGLTLDLIGNRFYLKDHSKTPFTSDEFCEIYEKNLDGFYLGHTSRKTTERIINYVETQLFPDLMNENAPGKVISLAGEVFWWICQAKPWRLGDPSIAEALIKGVFKAKGIRIKPWKQDLIPWKEVCLAPNAKVFGQKFNTLFE